ncbi:MAG: hypothetical protein J6W29_00530 [Neisseriaceae bacterium]|nr:hypothetical protein [Neisseriaceae bacterium]
MLKNKWIISLLAIALCSVTACSPEMQSNLKEKIQSASKTQSTPVPQEPVLLSLAEMAQQEIEKNQQYIQSQIVEQDGKTMYFFDKTNAEDKNPLVSEKVAGGFYRIILGKTAAGHCAVQDFYADTDQKQMEPLIVNKEDCDNFASRDQDGTRILYDENQQIDGVMARFKDGKVLNGVIQEKLPEENLNILTYFDFADEPKNTITVKAPDNKIIVTVFNNQIPEQFTMFGKNDQNKSAVVQIQFVNGQADFATSHRWIDGKEKPIDKKQFEQVVAELDIASMNKQLQEFKKQLQGE